MKPLNEREAWIIIRREFKRLYDFGVASYVAGSGLCNAVYMLARYDTICCNTACNMHQRITANKPQAPSLVPDGYYWDFSKEGTAARIKFIDEVILPQIKT